MPGFCPLLPSNNIANEEKVHARKLAPDEEKLNQDGAKKADSDH